MSPPTVALFVNPAAGRGRAGRNLAVIQQEFHALGIDCPAFRSSAAGDIEAEVHRQVSRGCERVVVIGGDGSVHEAVNALMRSGSDAHLGVVPIGTGNDFAKAAKLSLPWRSEARRVASRIAAHAPVRPIDVIRINDRYVANGAGVGLDARVTALADERRWPPGKLVYLTAVLEAVAEQAAAPELSVEAEDFRWRGPVTLIAISNGPWIGGMFRVAPAARNDDGRLDLLLAEPLTRRRILRLIPKLLRGRHLAEPDVHYASLRRLRIEAAAPVPMHLDGELQPMQTVFDVEVLPGSLKLL